MDWSLIGILLIVVLMLACCWAMMRVMMSWHQNRQDQEHNGGKEK